jgi:hypothetical protein
LLGAGGLAASPSGDGSFELASHLRAAASARRAGAFPRRAGASPPCGRAAPPPARRGRRAYADSGRPDCLDGGVSWSGSGRPARRARSLRPGRIRPAPGRAQAEMGAFCAGTTGANEILSRKSGDWIHPVPGVLNARALLVARCDEMDCANCIKLSPRLAVDLAAPGTAWRAHAAAGRSFVRLVRIALSRCERRAHAQGSTSR